MKLLEMLKWGLALLGGVCGFALGAYYWLAGAYNYALVFVGLFFAEMIVFIILATLTKPKAKSAASTDTRQPDALAPAN